jgi:hypothetical protein
VRTELDDWLAAARIDRGKLFRRVNKVGRTWGDGMTVKAVWHIVKESPSASAWRSWRHTIFDGPVLGSAMLREASWSRSNSSWGMSQFKRPNDILAASSGFDQRSMTILVSSRILEFAEGLPTTRPGQFPPNGTWFGLLRELVNVEVFSDYEFS